MGEFEDFFTKKDPVQNGALNFMDIMTAKTARDFGLELKAKGKD